jgi:tetratricopeptide (TPR) repeat protein
MKEHGNSGKNAAEEQKRQLVSALFDRAEDALRNKKDRQEAIRCYTEAIAVAPDRADAYFKRGSVYLILKQYDAAIADFNEAIRRGLRNVGVYLHRGFAHYDSKTHLWCNKCGAYSERLTSPFVEGETPFPNT